jgi:dTDP-4-amino-4,6-dideoxygalactose transaminase
MDGMVQVARRHNLILIEDCSQAHMTRYNDRLVGTFGDIGCFSLQQSKHMTTGDGGVTISANEDLAARMQLFRDKGWLRYAQRESRLYTQLGMNYRMNELSGAVAVAQMAKVAGVAQRRHDLGTLITSQLEGLEGVCQVPTTPGGWHTYWLYPLSVTGWPAASFAAALSAEGVGAGAGYIGEPIFMCMGSLTPEGRTFGNSRHPLDGCHGGRVLDYGPGMCPRTEALLKQIVTLSLHEHMSDDDAQDMATAIRKVAENLPR